MIIILIWSFERFNIFVAYYCHYFACYCCSVFVPVWFGWDDPPKIQFHSHVWLRQFLHYRRRTIFKSIWLNSSHIKWPFPFGFWPKRKLAIVELLHICCWITSYYGLAWCAFDPVVMFTYSFLFLFRTRCGPHLSISHVYCHFNKTI